MTEHVHHRVVTVIRALSLALLLPAAIGLSAAFGSGGQAADAVRATANTGGLPNIVVVMTDDQDLASMRVMSNVQSLLGNEGTNFKRSFVSYSLCCPSRATFLTGQYAHNHGVLDNKLPNGGFQKLDSTNTLPLWLQRAGYHTGQVGKYLNGYGIGNPRLVPPGWSEWYASFGAVYFDYNLNENGNLVHYDGAPTDYNTDVLARKAVDFIRRRAPSPTPFFLNVTPNAPHEVGPNIPGRCGMGAPRPAPRHVGRFGNEPLPMPASFNEADNSDKPAIVRNRPSLSAAEIANITRIYRCRLESLLAVDDAVKDIVGTLAQTGELENTLIVYTSDNGFLLGEHRVKPGKVLPYEESIRVPLVMRGPGVPRGKTVRDVVANVDLAPTIVDAANASAQRRMDGRSLFPLMANRGDRVGRAIILESATARASYTGIRTKRYMYSEYANGNKELYDVDHDGLELRSVQNDNSYARAKEALARDIGRMRACSGGACRERPRVALRLGYRAGRVKGRRCVRSRLRARVGGQLEGVERVKFSVGGRSVASDSKRPFRRSIRARRLKAGRRSTIRAFLVLTDGRELTRDRMVRGCSRR